MEIPGARLGHKLHIGAGEPSVLGRIISEQDLDLRHRVHADVDGVPVVVADVVHGYAVESYVVGRAAAAERTDVVGDIHLVALAGHQYARQQFRERRHVAAAHSQVLHLGRGHGARAFAGRSLHGSALRRYRHGLRDRAHFQHELAQRQRLGGTELHALPIDTLETGRGDQYVVLSGQNTGEGEISALVGAGPANGSCGSLSDLNLSVYHRQAGRIADRTDNGTVRGLRERRGGRDQRDEN